MLSLPNLDDSPESDDDPIDNVMDGHGLNRLNEHNHNRQSLQNHQNPTIELNEQTQQRPINHTPGTFLYKYTEIPNTGPSLSDINLFEIRQSSSSLQSLCPIFGQRRPQIQSKSNSNNSIDDSGYFIHWIPTTMDMIRGKRTERLKNGCIIFPDDPFEFIDYGFLLRMKQVVVNEQEYDLFQPLPDEYCLYRILSLLRYGVEDQYRFIEHQITTFVGKKDKNGDDQSDTISDEVILGTFGRLYNITFIVIDSVDGDEPEKYGFPDDPNIDDDPSTNRVNQNKVTLYRYSDRFYFIRKDPHSPSPIPLITNQTASNLLTQNLVNTQELHKRHIRRKAEFKKCVVEMLKAMQQDERPRYDTVKMLRGKQSVVHSEIPCSVKIGRLYQWVKQSYDSAHPGNSGYDIKGELKDHGDGVREQCEAYFPAIKAFLERNGEFKVDPMVYCHDHYKSYPLHKLVQTFTLKHHRIAELNGQTGVRALENIPSGTVLGQYLGVLTLEEEYQSIYADTTECSDYDLYSSTISLNHNLNGEMYRKMFGTERKIKKENKPKRNEKIKPIGFSNHSFKIVIDALRLDRERKGLSPFMYMNDVRRDIHSKIPSAEDEVHWNIKYVTVYINDWPATFVVTRRDVKKGEELCWFYGEGYGGMLLAKERRKRDRLKRQKKCEYFKNELRKRGFLSQNK